VKSNKTILLVSVYKIFMNLLRISLVALLFLSDCNVEKLIDFLSGVEIIKGPVCLLAGHLTPYIREVSHSFMYIFLLVVVIFSTIELFFAIQLLLRKESGAIGLFVMSILWTPVELVFFSEFFILRRLVISLIDIVIILLLFRMILHPRKYFQEK